jgi:hypothetical protein
MGPATALRVQAGDKVELDAWVCYKTKPTYHRHITPLLMGQQLSGTYAGLGVFEGFTSGEESLPNRHKRVAFSTAVVLPEDGFIYIWLSNESEGSRGVV